MKAKELASILNKVSVILDAYGDVSIEKALDSIIEVINKTNTVSTLEEELEELPFEDVEIKKFMNELEHSSSEEIVNLLSSKPKKFLLEIAKKLSISSSSRQSIAALSHNIVKFYERSKIDEIIRNERHE